MARRGSLTPPSFWQPPRADASPDLNSYLRFDVQGLTGSVTSATLRIYANSSSSTGYTAHSVTDNTWGETTITYSNAPTMGASLGSSGSFSANAWTTVDVTAYITGNGTYSVALNTTSNTNINFSSREGANAPQLVIETSTGATNTPTATATTGPSPTPTRTPTAVGTNTPTVPPTVTPTTQPVFQNATFVYDGDGKRVKSIINSAITTYFVGAHYEVSGSTITKYYYAGAQRIAMRSNGTLNYLLGDHLGSTSLTTDAAGNIVSEIRYKAWGKVRYATEGVPTKYQYTGQFSYMDDFGLMFYNARWYDPVLGRFAQADSIIPEQTQGVQAWDRYAYVSNNPVKYIDPSGHGVDCGIGMGCVKDYSGAKTLDDFRNMGWNERKRWLEDLIHQSGSGEWFDDIKGAIGIISTDPDYKDINGAVAYQNAAVLQAINDGWRIYNGSDPMGEGGSEFGKFFYNLRETNLLQTDPNQFIVQRYEAEIMAISYAVSLSKSRVDASSTRFRFKFVLYQWGTDQYRAFGVACRGNPTCVNTVPVNLTDPRTALDSALFQNLGQVPGLITDVIFNFGAQRNLYYRIPLQ